MLVLYAALINWIVTTILVDSHLFQKPRDWCVKRGTRLLVQVGIEPGWHDLPYVWPEGSTQEQADAGLIMPYGWRGKLAQLVTCHLCIGTWIGFAEAVYFGGPFHGWAAIIANGLLFRAGGHLILELRSKVAA